MDFLNRKLKMNDWNEVTYPIMTKQECSEREIPYIHWKKAQKGDFGISDDSYVAECLDRRKYKNSTQVVYPYGRQWITPKAKFLYEPHRDSGMYSQSGTRPWVEREASMTRTKNAVSLYVQMMLTEGKIDWHKLGKTYRPDQDHPNLTAKRLFKQERIKRMVDDKLQKHLDDRNMNQGEVLDIIADAIGIAKTNNDPSNMLRGAEQYIRIMDMLPSKNSVTDTVQIDVTKKILDEIAGEESSRLKLERKQDEK